MMKNCQRTVYWWLASLGLAIAHVGHHPPTGQQPPQQPSVNDLSGARNEEHIKEHLQNEINVNRQMSPEELEFHYFRLHDINNDTLLDGLEILKALTHMLPAMDFTPQEIQGKTAEQIVKMRELRQNEFFNSYVQIIDKVLLNDDIDNDGYISYPEFIKARRRDEKMVQEMRQQMAQQAQFQQQQMYQQQQYQQQQMQQQQLPQQQYQQGQTQQFNQQGQQQYQQAPAQPLKAS